MSLVDVLRTAGTMIAVCSLALACEDSEDGGEQLADGVSTGPDQSQTAGQSTSGTTSGSTSSTSGSGAGSQTTATNSAPATNSTPATTPTDTTTSDGSATSAPTSDDAQTDDSPSGAGGTMGDDATSNPNDTADDPAPGAGGQASDDTASGTGGAGGDSSVQDPAPIEAGVEPALPIGLLVFSATGGFRHDSIGVGVAAMRSLAEERGWRFDATEDATRFTDESLAEFDVVMFLNTTGEVLSDPQQAAFERFIQAGNGFVGVHAASDTEFEWPWFGDLVGAYFASHPEIQDATLIVDDSDHVSTSHLPNPWQRRDEWYAFDRNPRDEVSVLLSIDESSYSVGDSGMNGDHPLAWYHIYDGGRSFYTALGHTSESYSEPAFLQHVEGGIVWAAGRE